MVNSGMRRRGGGFTLVELLVAMVIMGLVLTLASSSFSWFVNRMDQVGRRFDSTLGEVRNWWLLGLALEGIYDYYLPADAMHSSGVVFFKGEAQRLRAVTTHPLFGNSDAALLELELVAGGAGYDLVYREWPLVGWYLEEMDTVPPLPPYELIMFSGVEAPVLDYYGRVSRGAEFGEQLGRQEVIRSWTEGFEGAERELLPDLIRLRYTLASGESEERIFVVRVFDELKGVFYASGSTE